MDHDSNRNSFTRRRFAFWVGFGLFSLGERLHAAGFDELAAAAMRGAGKDDPESSLPIPEHWQAAENRTWRWFEREQWIDGRWKLTGITTPIHKQTGEAATAHSGYLDASLVPVSLRREQATEDVEHDDPDEVEFEAGQPRPDPARRARHGRPPSKWLRSLHAAELRTWLRTIQVPEAGVSGMTFWTHLTRDHSFSPVNIEGLTIDEQAKLHAAAHHGY